MNECLDLAADAHAIYLGLDVNLRRIANQAMFERINIVELDPDDPPRIDAAYAEPFDRLLDPRAHAQVLELQRFQEEVQDDAGLMLLLRVKPLGRGSFRRRVSARVG